MVLQIGPVPVTDEQSHVKQNIAIQQLFKAVNSIKDSAAFVGGTTAGSANAQTLAVTIPTGFTLTAGYTVTLIAGFSNTGATTLSVNGTTATAVQKSLPGGLIALSGGEIISGASYLLQYNGTVWELLNPTTPSLTNTRNAQTGNYTVLNADKGDTISLEGNAFYTLTFGNPTGYDANFSVMVINNDTGRAKWISLSGTISFYLWPRQTCIVVNNNNIWRPLGRSRWKLPSGALTINTDFTNGSDTNGVADGLATGAGAFKTVQHALGMILNEFDLDGTESGQSQITVLMAAGSTDSSIIHFSPHATAIGAQGGAAIKIDGNGGSITGGMQFYFGAVVEIRNVTISSQTAGVNAIDAQWGSKIFLLDGITFAANAANLAAINAADFAHVELDNNITVSGAGSYLFIAASNSNIIAISALTITLTSNITVTNTVLVAACSNMNLANVTWSLGGHTVTATNKYVVTTNGVLSGSANVPGSGAANVNTGGQAV